MILAMGTQARVLGIPGEQELNRPGGRLLCHLRRGILSGPARGGSGQRRPGHRGEYVHRKFASKVTVIVLHEEACWTVTNAAAKALAHPKLQFVWNSVVEWINGEDSVTSVTVKNIKTGARSDLPCSGVFFFVGLVPSTQILKDSGITCTEQGLCGHQ